MIWNKVNCRVGENICNEITDKKICVQITMTDTPQKWWGDLNRHFTEKENWKANKHLEWFSNAISNQRNAN